MKPFYQNLLLLSISCIVTLGLVEIGMRISINTTTQHLESDDYLGWIAKKNAHYKGIKKDGCVNDYQLIYNTNKYGFRKFGDTSAHAIRILFIGDSFTHAIDASDDSTYYALLGKWLNFEVFGFGTGGYGTLQEALQLEKIINQVKPHLVVLQFCENDFINNSFELEKVSVYHNNQHRRPYLNINGSVFYANPIKNPLLSFFIRNSKLLSFIAPKIKILLRQEHKPQKAYHQVQREVFNQEEYNKAKKITDICLKKIKVICKKNGAILVSFPVDSPLRLARYKESKTPYELLMQQNNIEILGNVPEAIENHENQGVCCRAEDGAHWNHTGHLICAQALMNRLQYVITHEIKQ